MAQSPPPHLVLARKWRPERFADLVGQDHITRTLSQALERGRIAHAFLFTGIRGVGKTTAARILARCLDCERGPTADPCGECAACVEIREGRSLDVAEIDGATYRKIDDARAIIENLNYRPARDRFKIYIIDEAHQLTDQAFNALLKTLEEPPPHVKFILATTEPQKMPETILSRLQRYDFRRIPLAIILARLQDLARREGIEAEEGALRLLAREAGGSMRDAERMLETAIASSADGVSEAEVASSLGVASRSAVMTIVGAVLTHDAAAALNAVRNLASRGANLESLGRDLLETVRNLAVAKLPVSDGESPLDDLPDHEAAEVRRLSQPPSSRDLMRLFHLMARAQEEILRSPYPDLLLEMAVIRMASLAPVIETDQLLRAIGEVSGEPPGSGSAGGAGTGRSGGSHGPAPRDSGARRIKVAGEVNAGAPARAPGSNGLAGFRDHIRNRKAALAGFMEHGAELSLSGDVLVVNPRNDVYVRYLGDNLSSLEALASEFYGRPIRVEIVSDGESGPAGPDRTGEAGGSGIPPSGPGAAEEGLAKAPREPRVPNRNLYSDPEMREIFDAFEARLVEVRNPARQARPSPPDQAGSGKSE